MRLLTQDLHFPENRMASLVFAAGAKQIQGVIPPAAPTGVTMGAFAAQQTTISVSWTTVSGATSYTVNFLSNAANSTSGGSVWQTFTGTTGTSQTSSSTLISGSNGTYYYATVAAVNAGGSSSATASSSTIRFLIPLWIGTLSYWFDASDTATITASGNRVTSWTNKGNASAGNATTGAATIVNTNSTTINSKNTVRFGTSTYLVTPNYTAPSFTASFFTTFRGAASLGTTNGGYWFCYNNSAGRDFFLYNVPGAAGNNKIFQALNTIGGEIDYSFNGSATITSFQTPSLISVVASNTNTAAPQGMWWNGSNFPVVSRTGGNSTATYNSFLIGANRGDFVPYDMGDFLIFPSVLSTANRQRVEGWLAWKWGLQASLVAGHPYTSASP